MPLLADIPAQGLFTGVINFFYKKERQLLKMKTNQIVVGMIWAMRWK